VADLAFRALTAGDDDLTRFAACFEANGDPKDVRHLRWQYREPPVGRTYVDAAEDASGRLGGIYAVFPTRFRLGDRVVTGVQSLDTLTDEHHRGKGLFTKLAKRVYDRCTTDDVALVYGFPNGSSAHGFFEKLGWTRLDPVPFLVRPLSVRYLLRRARVPEGLAGLVPAGWPTLRRAPRLAADEEVAVTLQVDEAMAAVWTGFATQVRAAVERDLPYLRWRLSRPKGGYKLLVFRRGGAVLGWTALTVLDKHGGRVGYVMELLYPPSEPRIGEALAHAALDEMRASGAEVALAWCLDHAPNRDAYRAAGFRTLPQALRPIELHFGVRALAAPADAALANRENWYLSYLDSDTV
jgi:GNAT superfamily N-acetyltransferase